MMFRVGGGRSKSERCVPYMLCMYRRLWGALRAGESVEAGNNIFRAKSSGRTSSGQVNEGVYRDGSLTEVENG